MLQPYLINAEPLQLELSSFIKAIETDSEPVVTGSDGLNALKICEAAFESLKMAKK
jgi:predicted dehydrogenase